MESTTVFKLKSGVECEAGFLTGEHQELFTRQDKRTFQEKLCDMLAAVIIRVGTNTSIDRAFVEQMHAADKKKALVEIRQFSLDYQPTFTFMYEYLDSEGKKQKEPVTVDLEDGHFPEKPTMVMGIIYADTKDGEEPTEDAVQGLVPMECAEYVDVPRSYQITLPKSKQLIELRYLDGAGEKAGAATKKANRSINTPIMMRSPVYFHKADKDTMRISLNLNKLHAQDLAFIREAIKLMEGDVDTLVTFEHPEADTRSESEKNVSIDVLSTISFFFLTEAI